MGKDAIDAQTECDSSRKETRSLSWLDACKAYLERRVLVLLLLGFSAGLPFLLVFSTLSAWLRDGGISRSTIGFFSWIGITYSIKVFWAPVVDRVALPGLGRLFGQRRSWMLLAQIGIACGLLGMALTGVDLSNPDRADHVVTLLALFGLLVAFSSATQDIAIDAYRIEVAEATQQGVMSAAYIFGYRLALLVAGAGAFYIADFFNWSTAYLVMASLVVVGILAVCIAPQVARKDGDQIDETLSEVQWINEKVKRLPLFSRTLARWFVYAVVCPFTDFVRRQGKWAILLLLIVGIYRISDITMGVMANPFYIDMGYTKSEVASISKVFGFFLTMIGSAFGGLIVVKYGLLRPLLLGAGLVAITNLLFALMAWFAEPSLSLLAVVIGADNFSGGLANVAFIAFLSSLTSRSFTATQYALFSSLMTLPGKFIGGYSGVVVDLHGYEWFFIYAATIGVPAFLCIFWLLKKRPDLDKVATRDTTDESSN
ncbi:AmpG family muropeptide MFS transporter [Litoribrevibacter albus]|uniref:MFS transporter n=1 Tax=Litoribrevibacter albus TaxID=1473156 RepID=A0AA37S687_9GAMM|nr:MFS transporter [Litoribrevibacter albus]GLQ29707.1 MFS transporter [Litoribrevibacter albus]